MYYFVCSKGMNIYVRLLVRKILPGLYLETCHSINTLGNIL